MVTCLTSSASGVGCKDFPEVFTDLASSFISLWFRIELSGGYSSTQVVEPGLWT